jgi:hypothetical protein
VACFSARIGAALCSAALFLGACSSQSSELSVDTTLATVVVDTTLATVVDTVGFGITDEVLNLVTPGRLMMRLPRPSRFRTHPVTARMILMLTVLVSIGLERSRKDSRQVGRSA